MNRYWVVCSRSLLRFDWSHRMQAAGRHECKRMVSRDAIGWSSRCYYAIKPQGVRKLPGLVVSLDIPRSVQLAILQ
jgi:hypothetical protein